MTAYSLAFGGLLLLGGRLPTWSAGGDADHRPGGLRRGLGAWRRGTGFGDAGDRSRAIQGAFGAMLAPAALSTLTMTFTDPAERGKAFGVYGAIAGAGGAVGCCLAGC